MVCDWVKELPCGAPEREMIYQFRGSFALENPKDNFKRAIRTILNFYYECAN